MSSEPGRNMMRDVQIPGDAGGRHTA
jgi:hypothetical protein